MNPNTASGESFNGRAHVHRVSAESVQLRHYQHVAFFHFDE